MDNDKAYHEPTEEEMAPYIQHIQTQLDTDLVEIEMWDSSDTMEDF